MLFLFAAASTRGTCAVSRSALPLAAIPAAGLVGCSADRFARAAASCVTVPVGVPVPCPAVSAADDKPNNGSDVNFSAFVAVCALRLSIRRNSVC